MAFRTIFSTAFTGTWGSSSRLCICMAFLRHVFAHTPHPKQRSASTVARSFLLLFGGSGGELVPGRNLPAFGCGGRVPGRWLLLLGSAGGRLEPYRGTTLIAPTGHARA